MSREDVLAQNIIIPFIKAWNLFFDISIPLSESVEAEFDKSGTNNNLILFYIPAIGLILGLFAYIISWIICIIAGRVIGTIICPFIIILTFELLTHGKDTNYLVMVISAKCSKKGIELENLNDNNVTFLYTLISIFLIKLFSIAIFIYFNELGWLIITEILTYSIQGHAVASTNKIPNDELLPVSQQSIIFMWIISGILCIIFGAVYFPLVIVAFIITILLGLKIKKDFIKSNYLSGGTIGLLGKGTELLILLVGLLFRFHF